MMTSSHFTLSPGQVLERLEMTRDVSASQVLDRLERLEYAVESLQKHVKWLLERTAEPEGLTLKELADRLDGRLDHHIGMIDAHKRG